VSAPTIASSIGPSIRRGSPIAPRRVISDARVRARMLLAAVAARLIPVLYNEVSQRLLHFAAHCYPDFARINLRLGIACLMTGQWEGLAYLRRAHRLDPDSPLALQALYLAIRSSGHEQRAREWLRIARAARANAADTAPWRWTELEDEPFSSLPFDGGMALSVEASLRSSVTGVLLGEGDWFETEMELWRTQIREGMTVIDVGANVGVYTFSAAQRVGVAGRVYAVEPFSGCVRALEETCRVNGLTQVRVRAGAASDANGTARLALHSASEVNSLEFGAAGTENFEVVRCFTLDSLVEEEGLQRVDWLKIDAEGHEMSVLRGAERLIRAFKPGILYENIASGNRSNSSVAAHLQSLGYQLFRYRGYVRELVPVSRPEEIEGNLNVVALHEDRP
jgi:FkbM family methyltransferase